MTCAARIRRWKAAGYGVEIVFLQIESVELALKRIADRVRQGGHHVPAADVVRRFQRGWSNFLHTYRTLADSWVVYDNTTEALALIEQGP